MCEPLGAFLPERGACLRSLVAEARRTDPLLLAPRRLPGARSGGGCSQEFIELKWATLKAKEARVPQWNQQGASSGARAGTRIQRRIVEPVVGEVRQHLHIKDR